MADKPETHDEMLEQAMVYYGGDLSAAEAAAFEAHLATCAGCQESLRFAKERLPVAEALLAFTPKRSIEEQVQRFEAMVAERRRAARPRRARLWIGLVFGAAMAAAVTFALLRIGPRLIGRDEVYAPEPPPSVGSDAG